MRRYRLSLLVGGIVLLLVSLSAATTFTVSTEPEWKNGTLDGVTVRNDRLELETPLESIGFETELALSFWDIYLGDAFVPETAFTGNDAIAFNGSDPVPGVGNVTQLNFTIPDVYVVDPGSEFSAWTKHNGSESSNYRITYRLEGNGVAEAWVDESQEEVVCATDQAQQVINDSAAVDSWYRFVFTLYPSDDTVHCAIHDDAGDTMDAVNLSGTVDYDRVVIRSEGDRKPWAWFDDVTIPRYRAEGNYTSQRLDNAKIQDWKRLDVDAANITSDMAVNAVFWAQDSTGTVIERQIFTVTNGTQQHQLTVPNSQDATVIINGSTTDASMSWSVDAYTVRSNNTNISAPSISKPAVSPDEAQPGDAHEFTAELTDDDGDQNTVRLLRRKDGETTWEELNRTTITPVTANTEISFTHTFTAENTTNYFYFNTTDAHNISDTTATGTFNTTYTPSSPTEETEENETVPRDDGSRNTTDNASATQDNTTAVTANDTEENATDTDDTTDTEDAETDDTQDGERGTDEEESTGAKWLRFIIFIVVALAAIGGYFLYTHTR